MLLAVSLAVAGGSACAVRPAPVDTSLLTGEPCEPPCWHGLTPGVSTEDEVNEFLLTSELVDRSTIFRRDVTVASGDVVGETVQWWSKADTASGWRQPRQFGNEFMLEDGLLQKHGLLQCMTIFLDYEVTLEDLLERYGPPEKFTAWYEGVEVWYIKVTLYYPRHGFETTLIIPPDDPQLRPESEVTRVWYFRAAPLEEFFELTRDSGYPTVSEEVLQEWHGYGPIELVS